MSMYENNLIPKSVEECYKTDEVTAALIKWSKDISTWGKIFITLTCICGFIISIVSAAEMEGFLPFIVTFLPFALSAFAEYFVFKFISFILYVIASFHENSMITANVALYCAAKEDKR